MAEPTPRYVAPTTSIRVAFIPCPCKNGGVTFNTDVDIGLSMEHSPCGRTLWLPPRGADVKENR